MASENGALRGGKVGGIGDVIRDLPLALAEAGHRVAVITPGYSLFGQLPGAEIVARIPLVFGGRRRIARLGRLAGANPAVEHLFIDHSMISAPGPGVIYRDDGPHRPFESDATRFAFFSAAVAAWLEETRTAPDVVHLHDWHTGFLLALRRFDRAAKRLRAIRTVFTIHNLAIQGIRPLRHHRSSFEAWFPALRYTRKVVGDPRHRDCVNPMAMAIRCADMINAVSPGYAREILRPSDPEQGFSGGEGLETDLRKARAQRRLTGILNGCPYPGPGGRRPGWRRLLEAIAKERHLFRHNRRARRVLADLPRRRPKNVLLSIGRITDQKTTLFLAPTRGHATALDAILAKHARDTVLIKLGSGDAAMERQLMAVAARHRNFLFLRGYSEPLPDLLYHAADLFLMPSSFEPCGISQMLAMRSGQPCVVHAVGGLRDTVTNGVNGFSFGGRSPAAQARNFVATVARALALKAEDPAGWQAVRDRAAAMRFSWEASAKAYLSRLYES